MKKRTPLTPDQILEGHQQQICTLANLARRIIRETVPEASEVAYPGWHAIGYRHPEAGYFCGVFPYEDHIKIYFEYGRFLPDPDRLLEGDGRQTRHVVVQSPENIPVKALKTLLAESILFKKGLPPKSKSVRIW